MAATEPTDSAEQAPLDYVVLHITHRSTTQQHWSPLLDLLRRGDLRLLDFALLRAPETTNTPRHNRQNAPAYVRLETPPEVRALTESDAPLLSDDDLEQVALDLPDGDTAAVLLLQSTWLTALIRGFGPNRCHLAHAARLPGTSNHPDWRL